MKTFRWVAIAGTVLATAAIIFALRGGWTGGKGAENESVILPQAVSYDSNILQLPVDITNLDELSFLTEAEKDQLRKDESELRPIYEKLEEFRKKSQSARDEILEKHRALFDREEELLRQGDPIREKIIAEFPNDPITPDNWREYIQVSKVLTEEEKKKMLEWEDELERLDRKVQKVLDEADAASLPYDTEWDVYDKKAIDIFERSRSLYEKIDHYYRNVDYSNPADSSTEE